MKKVVAVAIALAFALSLAGCDQTTMMVPRTAASVHSQVTSWGPVNADFEAALNPDGSIPGWSPSGPGIAALDTTNPHTGKQALKLSLSLTDSLRSDPLAVSPGDVITLRPWIRTEDKYAIAGVFWTDADGNGITTLNNAPIMIAGGAWQQPTGTFIAPPKAAKAYISFWGPMYVGSTFYVDDVEVTRSPAS